jgi:predicted nuclease with TOPRIM domain
VTHEESFKQCKEAIHRIHAELSWMGETKSQRKRSWQSIRRHWRALSKHLPCVDVSRLEDK